jgi:hypothetical protein
MYNHKQFAIAVDIAGVLQPSDNQDFIHQVRHYLTNALELQVASSYLHLLGIGLFELESSLHRDVLIASNVRDIEGVLIRLIRHDHGRNRRDHPYTRFGWIMMLGFPLDYSIDQAVASFGRLVSWHNNPRKLGFVLVKCLYNSVNSVPRSLVLRQGDRNGRAWCWSVPVYMLNWEHPEEILPPVDDLPPDGNPHPIPLPPAPAA